MRIQLTPNMQRAEAKVSIHKWFNYIANMRVLPNQIDPDWEASALATTALGRRRAATIPELAQALLGAGIERGECSLCYAAFRPSCFCQ